MSDIMVKELAKQIGAPVEILLTQLQGAGIQASTAEDKITTTERLQLLQYMQAGQKIATASKSSKLGLKKKSVLKVSGSRGEKTGKTVNVAVRRKKGLLKKAAITTTTSAEEVKEEKNVTISRSEQLAKQLEAERKAREAASKAAQKRAKKETKSQANVTEKAIKQETTPTTECSAEPEPQHTAITNKTTATTTKQQDQTSAPKTTATKTEKRPEEKPSNDNIIKQVENTEPPQEQIKTENTPVVTETKTEKTPYLSGKEQRDAVAAKARAEAELMFKRRPSRKANKPVEKPEAENKKEQDKHDHTTQDKAKKKGPKRLRNAINDGNELHLSKDKKSSNKRKTKKVKHNQPEVNIDVSKHKFEKPTAPVVREVEIPESIIVGDLAKELKVQGVEVIKTMMSMGVMATINQTLDQDTAILVVEEMGHKAIPMVEEDDETLVAQLIEDDKEYELLPRPPVVTIMGHVDHGKTSLLDYIRKSRVTAGEAGGITQHIGAYHVKTPTGVITFLDTPGHAAFSAMRARGTNATDIAILVVAADDGVMPQTQESIQHARNADVPLIVAINKIDKETADPERVKNELSQHEVIPDDWGGDDVFVNVSAHTGEGIDELLESILLVSEVLELKAPVEGPAKGIVVEASIEKGRGAVATVLVKSGTLKKGDFVLSGKEYGRVRALFNEFGKQVDSAGPSIPVSVLGLSGAPNAGDELLVVSDERKAKEIAESRRQHEKDSLFAAQQAAKLDAMFSKMKDGEKLEVSILIKADVQGSVEALRSALTELSTDEVAVKIVGSGVGGFSETDVNLAIAAGAVMIGFNVRADAAAKRIASEAGAEIRYYSVIYEVIDDVRDAMSGMLAPELREKFVGLAEVKEVFRSSSFGAAAGCLVLDGAVRQGLPIRVLRDNVVVFEGELESLRRHKDIVNEVVSGTECGIAVKNYNDVKVGDQIECFERKEVRRKI